MIKDKYIVGIGAANADIYCKSLIALRKHFDHPSNIKTSVGGVTRNVLENASRLGLNTVLLTAVGDDIYGDLILKQSKKANINVDNVLTIKNKNSGIFVQIQDNNNDMHLAACDMSINKYIDIDYICSKHRIISNASAIVIDPSLESKTIEYILSKYNNIPIFVDPVSDLYAKKIKKYLKNIYCIKPNKTELSMLSGIKIIDDNSLKKAFNIVKNKVKCLYVTLGKNGIMYIDDSSKLVKKKFKAVKKMANASGAGDALMASLLYSYLNDYDFDTTTNYCLAAGYATIMSDTNINNDLSIKLLNKIIKENK